MAEFVSAETAMDLADILDEFQRQPGLGHSAAHDMQVNDEGELAQLVAFMAWPGEAIEPPCVAGESSFSFPVGILFPEGVNPDGHSYRRGKTARQRLIVAGALVLAELRRLRNVEEQEARDA